MEGEKGLFPLFVQALNRGGIPPALRMFNLCLHTNNIKADNWSMQLTYVPVWTVSCIATSLNHALSYALRCQRAAETI